MTKQLPTDSVGLVVPQKVHIDEPLALASGKTLHGYDLVYETYGTLNSERSNGVLICHALSGHHHAAGYHSGAENEKPGWWESCIGPGKPIDTNKFFVVCPNNVGGCHGSTGPTSINPETGKAWGIDFPQLRFRDWVRSQAQLADFLDIETWAVVIGGSLGGMQAMRWSLEYPNRLRHCAVIASAMNLSAQNIAFNELARRAIKSDPEYRDGHYLDHESAPASGLALARMIAHITYLSESQMRDRFGRDLQQGTFAQGQDQPIQFSVESYLNYKGDSFTDNFDANSYLLITRMLDLFDLAREYDDDPVQAFSNALCKFLVVSFTTDWRFSPERSREISESLVKANKDVTYAEIETDLGHDSFLLPIPSYLKMFSAYMDGVAKELQAESAENGSETRV